MNPKKIETHAEKAYRLGQEQRYDFNVTDKQDWAHKAMRGVVNDLLTRSRVGVALTDLDPAVRQELVASCAEIIRGAHKKQNSSPMYEKKKRLNKTDLEMLARYGLVSR